MVASAANVHDSHALPDFRTERSGVRGVIRRIAVITK